MRSDGRVKAVFALLGAEHARYRAAVATAAAQMHEYVETHRTQSGSVGRAAAGELGRFAAGRMDSERFGALFAGSRTLTPDRVAVVARAAEVLHELHEQGDDLFAVDVPPEGDLAQAVHDALEEIGRAFGAALVFQAVRAGIYAPEQHDTMLSAFPFARWNRGERQLAPPLVVWVDGADVHAERLAEFVDGRQKIVLVVRAAAPPAPLVRLVTPGVFVIQATDVGALDRALRWDGPTVAALLSDNASERVARFAHDPAAGRTLAERLTIAHLPGESPRGTLGRRSAAQQREELEQLMALGSAAASASRTVPVELPTVAATAATVSSNGAPTHGPSSRMVDANAVDALAGWLLAQAGFGGSEVTT